MLSDFHKRLPKLEIVFVVAVLALVLQLSWPAINKWRQRPRPGRQVEQTMKTPCRSMSDYFLYLPANYEPSRKWPLLVYLHGAGSRGDDLSQIAKEGPPRLAANGRQFPLILASPQCPAQAHWEPADVINLIDEISRELAIDADRVYLTGFSMGGYGVWQTACAYPDRFAAVAPVSGGGDASQAERLRGMVVWAFHGADDAVVPPSAGKDMVDAARMAEAFVSFTVLPHAEHDICNQVYARQDFWKWLRAQHKSRLRETPSLTPHNEHSVTSAETF